KKSFKLYKLSQEDGIPFNRNIKQIISNQFLLSEKLDWLHFGFGTMALGRENIARAINAKMAVSIRGFDYYVFPVKNKNCYNLLFSKKVKFHVLSDGMIQGLKEKGISRNDVFKITPAVDIPLFNFQRKKENIILHITTIARLHWIKG